jgi:signal transduction histidine kinase
MNCTNSFDQVILNVDDSEPGRYARTRILSQMGFRVVEAGTGQEAIDLAERHKPLLTLLEVNLPDLHGFEVCRRLRNNPETAALTIVHISASSIMGKHQARGLDSGADGYIVEPVEPEVLVATLNAFIRARRAEEALRKSNEELRWFSYRVGHDLNEPLRTMAVYGHLLKAQIGTDPAQSELLDFISEATDRMRTLLDGLMKYAESTSSEQPEVVELDLEEVLSEVIADLDAAIESSGTRITHDPLPVITGSEQLEHVFQNLIANAIKYSRPGAPPEIHVSALREQAGREQAAWVFSVRDNGVGIEQRSFAAIFDIFKRLHGREIPGTGIGLAIARRIVEAHGGSIWVESEPGVGSVFFFRIPTERATPPA